MSPAPDHDRHEHDLGLHHDLAVLSRRAAPAQPPTRRPMGRRAMLGLLAGTGAVALAGCAAATTTAGGPGGPPGGGGGGGGGGGTVAAGAAGEIPQETAGPFPGDGSNGPNVLTESGIVRSDIRSSFASLSGTAEGVPLTIALTVTDVAGAAMPGATVYVWHCDREGRYSLYDMEDQNYLRGVQEADASGNVTFTSVFPAVYSGRWPHIHFEVYPDLASATSSDDAITTSQLALPEDVCDAVYATDGYSASVSNLAGTSLATDNIFSDGYDTQLAAVTGTVAGGLTATLTVPVAA